VWGDLGRQPEGWLYPSAVEGSAVKDRSRQRPVFFWCAKQPDAGRTASVYGDHSYTVILSGARHRPSAVAVTPLSLDIGWQLRRDAVRRIPSVKDIFYQEAHALMKFLVITFMSLALALPAFGKTYKSTYPVACSELWGAVKDTLSIPENYTVVESDDTQMTASYNVKHSAHQR
jgi:hypothetical protein